MAKTKKIDPKKVSKMEVSKVIAEALVAAGFAVDAESGDFGFTEGTLVVGMENTDVQVKFIVPKAGVTRYEKIEDEVAEVIEVVADVVDQEAEAAVEETVY